MCNTFSGFPIGMLPCESLKNEVPLISGHFSWRNTTNGSWFVQSLVHVLERQAKHDDLLSMMTDVNRHMIIHFESNCPCKYFAL